MKLNSKRKIITCLIFTILCGSLGIPSYASSREFKDHKDISSWAQKPIEIAVDKGFISGSRGYFRPKDSITRAEFTKIIIDAFDLSYSEDFKNPFTDLKVSAWYYKPVVIANSLDIVKGTKGKFNPNNNISREEMAAIIIRALEQKGIELEYEEDLSFKDKYKIQTWALDSINKISSSKIMTGSNGNFNPKGKVSREMATVSIMRAYDLMKQDVGLINKENLDVRSVIERTGKKMYTEINEAQYGTIAGEWTILSLARGNIKVPDNYYENYYRNIEKEVVKRMEEKGYLHRIKRTENSRLIMALTAIGKNPRNVGGYNLLEGLTDMSIITQQGINGPVFALIAFDTLDYEIPKNSNPKEQVTRDSLIDFILDREIEGGGWELGPNPKIPDPDITGMTIQALAPYYNKREDVRKAVDRGVEKLSSMQRSDGGYHSWGSLNSESVSQVIVALTSLGIDPHKDERFIKNGISAVENLLSFEADTSGFYHVKPGGINNGGAQAGQVDPMATDQAMYALVAYDRFIKNQNSLYNMTDIKY